MLPFKRGLSADKNTVTLKRLGVIDQEITFTDPGDADTFNILVLDTETTGLTAEDEMVEIGIAAFRCTTDGQFTHYFKTKNWLNEPSRPMHPEAEQVTGLSLEDLAGQRFDDDEIIKVLEWADLIIAHNARFDFQKMHMRYSAPLQEKVWLCSQRQIDWLAHGHDSAKLSTLAYEHGFFYEKHRTDGDIHALAYLLSYAYEGNQTYLGDLLGHRDDRQQLLMITKSPFASKDEWRPRGYRWHPALKTWWCLKPLAEIATEKQFIDQVLAQRFPREISYRVETIPSWRIFDDTIVDEYLK